MFFSNKKLAIKNKEYFLECCHNLFFEYENGLNEIYKSKGEFLLMKNILISRIDEIIRKTDSSVFLDQDPKNVDIIFLL